MGQLPNGLLQPKKKKKKKEKKEKKKRKRTKTPSKLLEVTIRRLLRLFLTRVAFFKPWL
jgi:hypothetical protein